MSIQLAPPRQIGHSAIVVAPIGLGCMSLSGVYNKISDEQGEAIILAALDNGVTFFDTADAYGAGHNEELVGRAIKHRRNDVSLATKFGNLGGRGGKFADGRPEFVISSCEASLKRLGVEVIDLYYQHRVDPEVPIEDTVGAMATLVQQGKVRALGLSEASPATIRRAHATHPIAAIQSEYSLLYREQAEETRRLTRELGISFVAYSPLSRGLFTAAPERLREIDSTDARKRHPRFQDENFERNLALSESLKVAAERKGCSVSQLALAWLLAQGDDVIAIPGTTQIANLIANVGALHVSLSRDDIEEIETLIPLGAGSGLRYPAAQIGSIYI